MERKQFLRQCGKWCFGSLVASTALQSCVSYHYAVTELSDNQLTINKSEFYYEKNEVQKERKFVLAKSAKLNFPICLFKLNEHTYSALYMECTHNSCELNPHGDFLICPCHGSEFNNAGKVQNPPAEKDLIAFKVTHDDKKIYIHVA